MFFVENYLSALKMYMPLIEAQNSSLFNYLEYEVKPWLENYVSEIAKLRSNLSELKYEEITEKLENLHNAERQRKFNVFKNIRFQIQECEDRNEKTQLNMPRSNLDPLDIDSLLLSIKMMCADSNAIADASSDFVNNLIAYTENFIENYKEAVTAIDNRLDELSSAYQEAQRLIDLSKKVEKVFIEKITPFLEALEEKLRHYPYDWNQRDEYIFKAEAKLENLLNIYEKIVLIQDEYKKIDMKLFKENIKKLFLMNVYNMNFNIALENAFLSDDEDDALSQSALFNSEVETELEIESGAEAELESDEEVELDAEAEVESDEEAELDAEAGVESDEEVVLDAEAEPKNTDDISEKVAELYLGEKPEQNAMWNSPTVMHSFNATPLPDVKYLKPIITNRAYLSIGESDDLRKKTNTPISSS